MKYKVEDMKCYQEVVGVLGKVKANKELFAVLCHKSSLPVSEYCLQEDVPELSNEFVWYESPQGHVFWENINTLIKDKKELTA